MRSMTGRFLSAPIAALLWIVAAQAQARDPEVAFESADGDVTVAANGATLGEILDRLSAGRGIEVEWRDQALEDKVMEGSFKGPIDLVAQRLLSGVSYIAFSSTSNGETRLTRIVVLGGATLGETAPPTPVEARARRNPPASPVLPAHASRFGRRSTGEYSAFFEHPAKRNSAHASNSMTAISPGSSSIPHAPLDRRPGRR